MALVGDDLRSARASKFLGLDAREAASGLLTYVFRDARNFLRRFALIRITLDILAMYPQACLPTRAADPCKSPVACTPALTDCRALHPPGPVRLSREK